MYPFCPKKDPLLRIKKLNRKTYKTDHALKISDKSKFLSYVVRADFKYLIAVLFGLLRKSEFKSFNMQVTKIDRKRKSLSFKVNVRNDGEKKIC